MDPNLQPTVAPQKTKMSKRTKAALWCLIGPTALYIVVFALYAVFNLVLSNIGTTSTPETGSLFAPTPPWQAALNIIMFIAGLIAFLTWLPGIIVGIILLATKPAAPQA